ncbi:glycosyltransferase family 4 protein [Nocardioides houyundeii]|uniref:glycosyltransferase family 4 protein n=1 Tax=Nocardioides houyundeii TaxID=2045452 RepID=UPI000DF2541E|nr:glycosyltransferase family 4 protein [Nocardioides houyundeii]
MTEDVLSMRVAVVYPHLPHYRYGVFRGLEERIADVLFVTGGASRDDSIATTPRGCFRREATVRNRWFGRFLWQQGLNRELNRFKPDAVVYLGDFAYLSTWASALWSRLRGRKVYFWTIGWHKPETGLRRAVRHTFYRLADLLLLYGDAGQDLGTSMGFPRERTHVIYNSYGSRSDAASTALKNEDLPAPGRPVIGAVIRLSPNKGLDTMIDTVAELNRTYGLDACCLIVGEGPERERLSRCAADAGVDLYLPGAVYSAAGLDEVYRRLDVTLVPRAAGLTVLQSLNAGAPVVTLRDPHQQMPEFEAIVDGATGSLVASAAPADFAEACAGWLERIAVEGDSIRDEIGANAGSKWSPESQARAIVDVLEGRRASDPRVEA